MGKRSADARETVRQRLVRFISKERAIHKAAAARHLGVAWSTVQHHARSLVRQRQLREIEYRGWCFLVPADVAPSRVARAVVLGVPEHKKMLASVTEAKHHRIHDVARRLHWSRKVARRCLYALLNVGLVEKSQHYHPRFRATSAGRAALRNVS